MEPTLGRGNILTLFQHFTLVKSTVSFNAFFLIILRLIIDHSDCAPHSVIEMSFLRDHSSLFSRPGLPEFGSEIVHQFNVSILSYHEFSRRNKIFRVTRFPDHFIASRTSDFYLRFVGNMQGV